MNYASLYKYRYYGALMALTGLIATVNYLWIRQNTAINAFDTSADLLYSLLYYDIWTHLSLGSFNSIFMTSRYYPPMVYIVTSALYVVFGTSVDVARMTGSLFLVVIAFAVFETGRHLFDEKTGLTAAFLMLLYPIVFGLSREYLLDIGLTCAFSVYLLFFVKSDSFNNRTYSLLTGLAAAAGMLTKWSFIVFLAGPIVVLAGSLAWNARGRVRESINELHKTGVNKRLVNVLAAALLFIVITSLWYIPNFSVYWGDIVFNADQGISIRGDTEASPLFLLSYLLIMFNDQLFAGLFLLFVAGAGYCLLRKDRTGQYLLLAFLVSYLLISMVRNKDMRYTVPLLVYVSLLSSSWIYRLKSQYVKATVILLILVVCPLQLAVAWDRPESHALAVDTPVGTLTLLPHKVFTLQSPIQEEWKIDEIAHFIADDYEAHGTGRQAFVSVLPDSTYFAGPVFEYVAYRDELDIRFMGGYVWYPDVFKEDVLAADYVMTKDRLNASTPGLQKNEDIIVSVFNGQITHFVPVLTMALPDHTNATVYRRKNT